MMEPHHPAMHPPRECLALVQIGKALQDVVVEELQDAQRPRDGGQIQRTKPGMFRGALVMSAGGGWDHEWWSDG